MLNKSPNAFVSALFILLIILFSAKAQLMLTDTDFWWHIAAGDYLNKNNLTIAVDLFSFTAGNYQWLNISWLWDRFYSWLNSISPLYLPIIITAFINALTLSIIAGYILKRVGPLITIIVILLSLVPYTYMLTPRPHQVTFLMAALFSIICHKIGEGKGLKQMLFLPMLMIIWANMHGGFITGFMIIGAFFLQALWQKNKRLCLTFALLGITCFAASLINPLGINLYAAINRTISGPMMPIISEWQALKLKKEFILHFLYIMVFIISFRPFNKSIGIAEKLLAVFWCVEAFAHERNLPIFVIFSLPVMASNLKSWSLKLPENIQRILVAKDSSYTKDFSNIKFRLVLFIVASVTFAALLLGLFKPYLNYNVPDTNPLHEAEFVKKNYPDIRFLNDYYQGGYLLYMWRGSPKLYIDGRAETVYPIGVNEDYLNFHYSMPGWEKMLDKYAIDGIILPRNNPNLAYFSLNSGWDKVFEGKVDNVYIRHK